MSDILLCSRGYNTTHMSSLADVYEGHVGEVGDVRRLYVGTGLFLAGAVLTVLAMLVATTGLAAAFGIKGEFTPNLIGGILAGIGVPAILLGVSTILPASDRLRAASVIGASIAVLGVALFWHAYPTDWAGYNQYLTPYVLGVYFLGIMITLGCLFVGIANFKERNDPGGTVSLEVRTESGETRIVEVDRSSVDSGGLGGVGMLGGTPDGEVETQTNRSETPQKSVTREAEQSQSADQSSRTPGTYGSSTSSSTRETNDTDGGFGPSGTASDGGAAASDISSPLDDDPSSASSPSKDVGDTYCGNCRHFRYVNSSNGMQPYCGYDEQVMDDMDACDEWQPNR